MEEALRNFLLADATIAASVGARASWGLLVQRAGLPAIRLSIVSRPVTYDMEGAAVLSPRRVQIDAYGQTYSIAKSLFRAVNSRLGGARQTIIIGGMPDVNLRGAFLDDERDMATAANEGVIYSTSGDFSVWAE